MDAEDAKMQVTVSLVLTSTTLMLLISALIVVLFILLVWNALMDHLVRFVARLILSMVLLVLNAFLLCLDVSPVPTLHIAIHVPITVIFIIPLIKTVQFVQ